MIKIQLLRAKKAVLLLTLLFSVFLTHAQQPGQLDEDFNPTFPNQGFGANGVIYSSAIQPDGKIIVGGDFSTYNLTDRNALARLQHNGLLDSTFNPGSGADSTITKVALQTDGKVLVVGHFSNYNGVARNQIARVNSDGTLDTTFDPGAGPNSPIATVVVQADGKILIGGDFTAYAGVSQNRVARLNTDGSLDTSFNAGTGPDGKVLTANVQPDGKIIIGGEFTSVNGISKNRLARLNPDGTLDGAFLSGTGADNVVHTTLLQPDGKITVFGYFGTLNDSLASMAARIDSNGELDTTFVSEFALVGLSITSAALQSDGKILVAGFVFVAPNSFGLVRLQPDGSIDSSFNIGNSYLGGTNYGVYDINVEPDGNIIIVGEIEPGSHLYNVPVSTWPTPITPNITRLKPDGARDWFFNGTSSLNSVVESAALQADGKMLIAGHYSGSYINGYGQTPILNGLARLNSNGIIDTSFHLGPGVNGFVYKVVLQPDEKVLLVGSLSLASDTTYRIRVIRLNTDYTLDTSFISGTGFGTSPTFAIENPIIQPDGKIIIGGNFDTYNGLPVNGLVRLNNDGSLDGNYTPGLQTNAGVERMAMQSDGKLIVNERYSSPSSGFPDYRILRLNQDGSIDSSFDTGSGVADGSPLTPALTAIAIQQNDKILISGGFTSYNGISRNGIARINSDGSLDTSFVLGAHLPGGIGNVIIQPDNKVIISADSFNIRGGFTFMRLNSDGSQDTGFHTGFGVDTLIGAFGNAVFAISLQPDNNIIVGGMFRQFDGIPVHFIARLFGGPSAAVSTDSILSAGFCQGQTIELPFTTAGIFDSTNIFSAELSDSVGSFDNPISIGQVTASSSDTIMAAIPSSTPVGQGYRIRIVASSPVVTGSDNGYDLTINPSPQVSASGAPAAVCAGQSTILAATGAATFNWSTGLIDSIITVSPVSTETYSVVGTSLLGCSDTATVTITVTPPPSISISSIAAAVCEGEAVSLSTTGAATYSWSTGQTDSVISVSPATTTTYTVIGSSASGCTDTVETTITVNQVPVIITTDTVACEGSTALLTVSGPTGTTYSWTGPNGFTSTDSTPAIVTPAGANIYTVSGTLNSCSDTALVTVTSLPVPQISATVLPDSLVPGQLLTLFIPNPDTSLTYTWTGPDLNQTTGDTVTANPSATGNLIYTVVANNGTCSDTATVTAVVVVDLSTETDAKGEGLVVYPNPFSTGFTVCFSTVKPGPTQILLFDGIGRQIFTHNYLLAEGTKAEFRINPDHLLPQGLYLLQVRQGDLVQVVKLVKKHQ